MKTTFNPIAFAENLSRAYEIAKCGGHTLRIFTDKNKDNECLTEADLVVIHEYFSIESAPYADILIEVPRPDAKRMLSAFTSNKHETKSDVDARIQDFQLADFPEFDRTLGKAETLLHTAIEKLSLDLSEISKVLAVAETIAKMDRSNKYRVEHIAEAIQYQSLPPEFRRTKKIL